MRQAQWKAMEDFSRAGKARAIGVSHYCKSHLDDIFEIATIPPAVNQVRPWARGSRLCVPRTLRERRSSSRPPGPPCSHADGWARVRARARVSCHSVLCLHACVCA